jgi:hypothetical protein
VTATTEAEPSDEQREDEREAAAALVAALARPRVVDDTERNPLRERTAHRRLRLPRRR